ncbi:hypothetical protein B7Z00_02945 [Candidatus Saccharibacteria bacterium 32-50-10]|nr:MAG: hypothetical protein B7Z00_02945 [Candidatus Saccharibacteria bacterium 32-50-10]
MFIPQHHHPGYAKRSANTGAAQTLPLSAATAAGVPSQFERTAAETRGTRAAVIRANGTPSGSPRGTVVELDSLRPLLHSQAQNMRDLESKKTAAGRERTYG